MNDELRTLIEELRDCSQWAPDGNWKLCGVTGALARRAANALEAKLPEEREGMCFCKNAKRGAQYTEAFGPAEWVQGTNSHSAGLYCSECGAELGTDGVARRNADTGRLDFCEHYTLKLAAEEHGSSYIELVAYATTGGYYWLIRPAKSGAWYVGEGDTLREAIDAAGTSLRAALDDAATHEPQSAEREAP